MGFVGSCFPCLSRCGFKYNSDMIDLANLQFAAYLMNTVFEAVHWNSLVCKTYPEIAEPRHNQMAIHCPCIDLLTVAQANQMLHDVNKTRKPYNIVVQERVLSQTSWSPSRNPNLMDESLTKMRCKAIVHARMMYELETAGGVYRTFELNFVPTRNTDLIMVSQHDLTFRVMQNFAMYRLIDLNMDLLAQIYPSRFIHDILGAGDRRNNSDDCKRYCEHHANVVILFADVVGFTQMCKSMQPLEIMELLTFLYECNDQTLTKFSCLKKLEIVGDCYVVVGGLMHGSSTQGPDMVETATQMLDFALALQKIAASFRNRDKLVLRIGIHCGPVTSGIIGRTSCKFMLFGDAMNTASRMESTCPIGKIQTSEQFHSLVIDTPLWTRTKGVVIKGLGDMTTYVYDTPLFKLFSSNDEMTRRKIRVGTTDE